MIKGHYRGTQMHWHSEQGELASGYGNPGRLQVEINI